MITRKIILTFQNGGRYHIETSPLICRVLKEFDIHKIQHSQSIQKTFTKPPS